MDADIKALMTSTTYQMTLYAYLEISLVGSRLNLAL